MRRIERQKESEQKKLGFERKRNGKKNDKKFVSDGTL